MIRPFRPLIAVMALALLGACAGMPDDFPQLMPPTGPQLSAETRAMYAAVQDGDRVVPAIEDQYISEARKRQMVDYYAPHAAGTIVVDPGGRYLYHVQGDNRAMRYLVAVGDQGLTFSGTATVAYQRDWPGWTPTQNMLRREPEKFQQYAGGVPGGLENPLGARALYLYRNGKDTYYRIHGTPSPWTVGHATSSGCIRMFNQDVMYLADRVSNGTKVIVLPASEKGKWTAPAGTAIAAAPAIDPALEG